MDDTSTEILRMEARSQIIIKITEKVSDKQLGLFSGPYFSHQNSLGTSTIKSRALQPPVDSVDPEAQSLLEKMEAFNPSG